MYFHMTYVTSGYFVPHIDHQKLWQIMYLDMFYSMIQI